MDPKIARLVSSAFLDELQAKALRYYVKADSFNAQDGQRFKKEVVHSEVFRAIQVLRQSHIYKDESRRSETAMIMEVPIEEVETCPGQKKAAEFLSREFIKAVSEGDPNWIKDVLKLLEIIDLERPHRPEDRDVVPWHYYAGMAAWERLLAARLWGRSIPNKKEVRERAIRKRALLCLDPGGREDEKKVRAKINSIEGFQPDRRHWTRIFGDLDLKDLPSAPTHLD